jgi:hypothetical protein
MMMSSNLHAPPRRKSEFASADQTRLSHFHFASQAALIAAGESDPPFQTRVAPHEHARVLSTCLKPKFPGQFAQRRPGFASVALLCGGQFPSIFQVLQSAPQLAQKGLPAPNLLFDIRGRSPISSLRLCFRNRSAHR